MNLKKATIVLKAMANRKRLEILTLLSDSEKSVGTLLKKLDLTQSALSQHLAVLRKAGVLRTKRSAQKIIYILEDSDIKQILTLLERKE